MLLDWLTGWAEPVADEPVGNVDVGGQIFGRGVLLEQGTDSDAQLRELRQSGRPVLESVNVGEGDDLPALQNQQPVIDAGLAAGGQPEVARHQAGADDSRLL